ncbi:hypothetical protein IJ541_01815 [bacterium]|nr:hypothetical protein [bacterium]MBQ9245503.1 hypothetical protein [bacterium]MBQ9246940.1 hypothetical protein [bacterium]
MELNNKTQKLIGILCIIALILSLIINYNKPEKIRKTQKIFTVENCEELISGYFQQPIRISENSHSIINTESICVNFTDENDFILGYELKNGIFLTNKTKYWQKYLIDTNGSEVKPNTFGKDIFMCYSESDSILHNYKTVEKAFETCNTKNTETTKCFGELLNANCYSKFQKEKIINF